MINKSNSTFLQMKMNEILKELYELHMTHENYDRIM